MEPNDFEKSAQLNYPLSSDCILLDKTIKRLQDAILQQRTWQVSNPSKTISAQIIAREAQLNILENAFSKKDCRLKIEARRLDESGAILSEQSAVQEFTVMGKDVKQEYVYIGIGAVVLLAGLVIMLRKK